MVGNEVENKARRLQTRFLAGPSYITFKWASIGLFTNLLNEDVSLAYVKLFASLIICVIFKVFLTLVCRVSNNSFIPHWNDYKFNLPICHQHIIVSIMKTAEDGTIV
jgi:hypothetical protein